MKKKIHPNDNELYDDVYCSIGFAILALIFLGGLVVFLWFKKKFGFTP